jgi:hypothetical protein
LSGKLKEARRKGKGSANTGNREEGEQQDCEGGAFVIGQEGKSRDGDRQKQGKSQDQDWVANASGFGDGGGLLAHKGSPGASEVTMFEPMDNSPPPPSPGLPLCLEM